MLQPSSRLSGEAVRIAVFAAFYGDRADGFDEALSCQPDVLIGDYLAELTMLVLKKVQARGGVGYAAGFLRDLEPHLPAIARAKVRLVTNAGGLDPVACAAAVKAMCDRHGLSLNVAAITGDNIAADIERFQTDDAQDFAHIEGGAALSVAMDRILTANAYLGAWPIVAALGAGADIVICPRTTDSSLVIGPAAWHHGWRQHDWDRLAGGLAAGHLIECGTQATGGNFSFFEECRERGAPGMPFVDVLPNGDSIVGKAPRTGGLVTVDTIKAQLLYEIGSRNYLNPDVILDLQSIKLDEFGVDRVRVSGCQGSPPTSRLKVSLCYDGGYRNSLTVGLTGLASAAKAAWAKQIVADRVGMMAAFDDFSVAMVGPADPGGPSYEANTAWLTIAAADRDEAKVGRARFSNVILSSLLSALPGCYFITPPQSAKQIAIQWPCLVEKRLVAATVHSNGTCWPVAWGPTDDRDVPYAATPPAVCNDFGPLGEPKPIGRLFGARSGDKGGTANLGVWAREEKTWAWLDHWLTIDALKEILPEIRDLHVERHRLPNLFAVNFLIRRFLGDGVSACLRIDPQAKGLGEYLCARNARFPLTLGNNAPQVSEPAAPTWASA